MQVMQVMLIVTAASTPPLRERPIFCIKGSSA